ncbi:MULTISPECIES: proteasome assembly chaperone family protein [unclassified Haladaptatus]|uniref:proteasome assembly chaperone family protein n=1 Tax=unclassified Haladaptatus TaxID=2622732 RepID=UPI0023E7EE10|nr:MULTISPECIES: PAC2 family protein [unclassified Haladaptatus]
MDYRMPAAFERMFNVTQEEEPSSTLVAGFSQPGLAGLTAVDYLVEHLDLRQTGYITTDALPSITPFKNGRPRHHTRLFSRDGLDITFLVGELFVPVWAADPFADAILKWADESDVDEICILSGVPVPHGPDDHRTFYIATEDYRKRRLDGATIPAMANGYLDGINGSIIERGIDSSLSACVYTTPVHGQAPDVEAALRLLEAMNQVYDLKVDTEPLESFAKAVQQHYADLANRLEKVESKAKPEDRMYM